MAAADTLAIVLPHLNPPADAADAAHPTPGMSRVEGTLHQSTQEGQNFAHARKSSLVWHPTLSDRVGSQFTLSETLYQSSR